MDEYFNTINQVAQANNVWSAQQAQKQMDFQERMSSTAHQREVADLKAAGLNPVLSAHSNGASTPTGAMASADTQNTAAMMNLVSMALEAQLSSAQAVSAVASGSRRGNDSGNKLGDDVGNVMNDLMSLLFGRTAGKVGSSVMTLLKDFVNANPDTFDDKWKRHNPNAAYNQLSEEEKQKEFEYREEKNKELYSKLKEFFFGDGNSNAAAAAVRAFGGK